MQRVRVNGCLLERRTIICLNMGEPHQWFPAWSLEKRYCVHDRIIKIQKKSSTIIARISCDLFLTTTLWGDDCTHQPQLSNVKEIFILIFHIYFLLFLFAYLYIFLYIILYYWFFYFLIEIYIVSLL